MIKKNIKKSYKGTIDLRDYEVKKAIQNNEDIAVTCADFEGKSVYTPAELTKPYRISAEMPSKYGSKPYKLYTYKWKNQ